MWLHSIIKYGKSEASEVLVLWKKTKCVEDKSTLFIQIIFTLHSRSKRRDKGNSAKQSLLLNVSIYYKGTEKSSNEKLLNLAMCQLWVRDYIYLHTVFLRWLHSSLEMPTLRILSNTEYMLSLELRRKLIVKLWDIKVL